MWIFTPYLYTSNTTGMNHLKTQDNLINIIIIIIIIIITIIIIIKDLQYHF